jgi:hypothetical protein
MKKILLFTAFIVSLNLSGQDFRFGVNIDPLISWFQTDSKQLKKDGSHLGFNGGLMMEFYFQKNYAFVTGINLANMGGNLLYEDSTVITIDKDEKISIKPASTLDYSLQYVSIPLALKMRSNQIGYLNYYAQVGFTPQVNIKARATATDEQLDHENVSEEINLFHLSYFIGGGIEYSLGGSTALTLGIFFNNGFIDVLDNKDYKASMNDFNLRFGIWF